MNGSLASSSPDEFGYRVRGPMPDLLDITKIRRDFPALDQVVHGHPLIYLDNAATTHKPRQVLDALIRYYETSNANVHRGVHTLGDRSTAQFENARARVRAFLNAAESREIIFVRGATEAINLVAQSFGRERVGAGDEVIVTWMEHHANIVPWQMLCQEVGATLKVVPVTETGELELSEFENLLSDRTKIVALSQVSNALGTVNPVKSMVEIAHRRDIPVLVDGAQAVHHLEVDVRSLDCDFYVFSGHKVYAPMGIGVLYGKAQHLDAMAPWQSGGDMVRLVSFEETTYNDLPHKFEAGTPNVAGAVGLATALDYLDAVGRKAIARHEEQLLTRLVDRLHRISTIEIIGSPKERAGVVSFVLTDTTLAAMDLGSRLDLHGVAVRTGHHCCQPLMRRFGLPGTVRASVALYNTLPEIDAFADALESIIESTGLRPASARSRSPTASGIVYPAATAPTVDAAARALLEEFDGLEGWAERYEFLIELGRKRLPMPRDLMTDDHRVWGCQSTVHLAARTRPGGESPHVVEFLATSDTEIVSGLLALLQHLFSGQPARAILSFDLEAFLSRTGLQSHLTSGRRTGLAEMIARLRAFAASVRPI